jgi:hypothetical protein
VKESLAKINDSLVFRETLNDASSVIRNGGSITDCTFENGVGTFNGSSSKITYPIVRGVKSIRIILTPSSTTEDIVKLSSSHSISVSGGTISATGLSSPTVYVNGIATSTVTATRSEIVITTATAFNADDLQLGYISSYYDGTIDLIEIYNRALTTSEVSNLYNQRYHKELPINTASGILCDFNTFNGTISERTGLTLTNTDVSTFKHGSYYSGLFNGSSSKIDTNVDFIGTNAVTFNVWCFLYGWGESGNGRFLDNGKYRLLPYASNYLYFSSNGGADVVYSAASSMTLNKWIFISVTRKADGKATFYIGDLDTPPTQSGSADQDSGTPAAGTSNVIIGNNSGQTRTFDGLIPFVRIYSGILSDAELHQAWSSTLKYIR